MTNNDILKKLRVALQLRDEQIVDILQLVDFRISKAEVNAFFRSEDHPKYMECGDQILRNFLNGLVIHLRGTKENPKNPQDILEDNKKNIVKEKNSLKSSTEKTDKITTDKPFNKKTFSAKKNITKKPTQKEIFGKVKFNNGKKSKES